MTRRLRRGEFHRRKLHGSGIAEHGVASKRDRSGQEPHGDQEYIHDASLQSFTIETPHCATSRGAAVASCFAIVFLTNIATVRLDFVKYCVATRWMSAGVTAAILSRAFRT